MTAGQRGSRAARRATGTTLIELMVVLVILSIVASVAALALPTLRPPKDAGIERAMQKARIDAIRNGRPVHFTLDSIGMKNGPKFLLFLPDGRILGGAAEQR